MKKNVITLLLSVFCTIIFAQKTIENPDYGFSTVPGELTKVELLEDATVLHLHIKYKPKWWIFVPKKTYIKDVHSDEKLFITKSEGIPLEKRFFMPESGEINYKLYFPKLNKSINKIDFGEANDGGTWYIYDIVLNENIGSFKLPNELRGDWLLTNGNNQWDYTFNSSNAIVDSAVWNYKSVEQKGKKYTINLEKSGTVKTIYAKLNNDGNIDFGLTPKTLQTYSLEKTKNPNYKLTNSTEYTESMFKIDSTTYSGVIKGYSSRVGQKTGTIHVNNVFTGEQYTHLVKIADDGSFSTKVAISHPQSILVRIPNFSGTVFVEPGKETFHFLRGKQSFFMGDCAQVNFDLQAVKNIDYFKHKKIRNKIGVTAPEDYKKICFDVRDKELKALEEFNTINFVSSKALQIKRLDIEYAALERVMGYKMSRRSLVRSNKTETTEKKKKPYKNFEVDESFYKFLTKEAINNKMAVLTSHYNYFVNRLMYADVFKEDASSRYSMVEAGDWLQKQGEELSVEELMMIEASKSIETSEILKKELNFEKLYGDIEQAFYRKHVKAYQDFFKENKEEPRFDRYSLRIADYLEVKQDTLSSEEVKMIEAAKSLKTAVELKNEIEFNKIHSETRSMFYKNYGSDLSGLGMRKYYSTIDNNIKAYFNVSDAYLYDVITFQRASKKMEDFEVYDGDELKSIQNKIKDSFLVTYLAVENEATKNKIELNKTKGDYHVNTIEKTEGDELFDAMIKKFKGKVVYVDFWATWCGPCKSGMKRIKPLKEDMKNEDVVFLYITNETSPEGTWKNSIPNIQGEHYRVSKDEWNYLVDKFKITGIPHYTLVNKKGDIVKPKMGHNSNGKLKAIFKQELGKDI